ncbi:MAG TPA: DUF2975 domain-containing protein [Patescibacteria group bacterium]|nr:DUF2975 domain-containing protein [Patescibacteria group bacterium]
MKKSLTIFFQIVVVIIGIGVLSALLWEPHLEGVNANSTFFEVYLDPFIALVYIGSVPFFIGVYQAFKALGLAGQNKASSPEAVKALRTIKYCAMTVIGFVVAEEIFIMSTHGNDDATGAFTLGILIIFGSLIVAVAAGKLGKKIPNAAVK